MGARDLSPDPVSVDVVFDRFPASVRGAVVVRGADIDPHQMVLGAVEVIEAGSARRSAGEVAVERATVDLAPRGEVFLPFELPFVELGPGWYGVVAEVIVDGGTRVRSASPGSLFSVPWPSGTVRRGTVPVDGTIDVPGGGGPRVERIDCRPDRAVVRWQHAPETTIEDLKVLADGKPLAPIEGTDRDAGRTTVVYPVMKTHRSLVVRLDRLERAGEAMRGPWDLEVPLD